MIGPMGDLRRTRRRIRGLFLGAAAALLLTACTSSTSGAGTGGAKSSGDTATTPSATGPSIGASASSATSTPPPTDASSSPPTALAGCTNAQISVSWAPPPGGGAASHNGIVLLFTNISSASCTLTGYPGVAGLDASGNQVAQATRTLTGMIGFCNCTTPPVLTLPPGDVVSAVVEGTAGGPGPCLAFAAMLVTPPNTTTSTKINASPYSCGFDVHPVVTGQAGQG